MSLVILLISNPTSLWEGQSERFFRKFFTKASFLQKSISKTYPSSSNPASIYGLPKTHKLNVCDLFFCPLVSSIDIYNYQLHKFLITLVDPIFPISNYTETLFTIREEIKKVSPTVLFLFFFDWSFFTGIETK